MFPRGMTNQAYEIRARERYGFPDVMLNSILGLHKTFDIAINVA